VELDQRLAPTAGANLAARNQRMAADGATVGGSAGQLAFVENRPVASHDACTPLGMTGRVLPAIHRRRGQARARESHVEEGKALVPSGHEPTITGHLPIAHGWRPSTHHWATDVSLGDRCAPDDHILATAPADGSDRAVHAQIHPIRLPLCIREPEATEQDAAEPRMCRLWSPGAPRL